ncbi:unnamed protein product [Allacma fusca]|uniref:DNA-directed RNA polymerase n=1 Tax=Allacma fusca TaxID=39272 RepID=A0A8J2LDF0_9HEXA|nr:unnamed protein product [Allacma fusca]
MNYVNRLKIDYFKYALQIRQSCLCCPSCAELHSRVPHLDLPKRFLSTAANPKPLSFVGSKRSKERKLLKKQDQDVLGKTELTPQEDKKAKLSKSARDSLMKLKREQLKHSGLEMNFNKSLLSYLDLCIMQGDHQGAYKTLMFYHSRKKSKSKDYEITDIAIYNCVLHGLASQGNLVRLKEVCKIMKLDGFKRCPQTFAAIFECLGRAKSSNCLKNVRRTIESLKSHGYTLDDVFNRSNFQYDQREVVLETLRKVHPEYTPTMNPPSKGYACNLLTHLNEYDHQFISPAQGLLSYKNLKESAMEQLQNELNTIFTIKSIEKKHDDGNTEYYREILSKCEDQWRSTVATLLRMGLSVLQSKTKSRAEPWSSNLFPFLQALKPEEYVEIVIMEIRKLGEASETYSPTLNSLCRGVGEKVVSRFRVHQKKEVGVLAKVSSLYEHYIRWYLNEELDDNTNSRRKWQDLVYESSASGPNVDFQEKEWSSYIISNIGRFLYQIILNDIKIDANIMKMGNNTEQLVPAFYSIFRCHGPYIKQEIKPHPVLVKLFQAASSDELNFDTNLLPMLCPPLPWSSVHTGGYLLSTTKLVRLPFQALQQQRELETRPVELLYPALDSLNQLGSIPWKINEPVLDILIDVFNNKGSDILNVPPPPSECPQPPTIVDTMTREEVTVAFKQRALYKRQKAEMYSLWCDMLYRLSLANHFRKRVFWLPHNMDFRGRVYPCPPHLSHLGADTARSILVFARGEPLGENGLDWLKIHLINLTGLKKRDSIKDRLQYANEVLDLVLDSAEKPLTGEKWWIASEEPWQTLACCMEIRNAIKSGNPESFVSHFPIHQDGSCNGLQHYAALGRDEKVDKQRAGDAKDGNAIAIILEGFIKRKVIKQTVMTTVYGVTPYGARFQILKQLKDVPNFPAAKCWAASFYLTHTTFSCLQKMFTSTKEIQDWFTDSARLISKICRANVEWVTPLGLPVVQPYLKNHKPTSLEYNPLKLSNKSTYDLFMPPNVMKQKNAFPPNYIHSLDSSHMMLTSLNCERSGITFVSVHDCFWTHPKSVNIMNKVCREQFVALHSQPLLEDLSKFLVKRYCTSDIITNDYIADSSRVQLQEVLSSVPPKGTFDLQNVLNSEYFFS